MHDQQLSTGWPHDVQTLGAPSAAAITLKGVFSNTRPSPLLEIDLLSLSLQASRRVGHFRLIAVSAFSKRVRASLRS
jgi:hypothetical protein